MFAETGFFVLLGILLVGYVLGMPFVLWLKSRATHEAQVRLGERASNLEHRLFKTEQELEALRELATERTTAPTFVE